MTSLEPEPLPADLIERLNYASLMPDFLPAGPLLERVHRGNWDVADSLIPGFQFTKHRQRLEDFQPCACYDLIYFDAFAPGKQASVWAEANIEKMFACLTPGGILVTYCAQGAFRRSLRKAGFTTERLPGFAKREMTRATKPVAAVPHLS
jgi:tRNA U34 5-methylaminomethyl-2-thiouridine-forming methyltransferase MnmC